MHGQVYISRKHKVQGHGPSSRQNRIELGRCWPAWRGGCTLFGAKVLLDMIAYVRLLVTHADAGKSVSPIRPLHHRGDNLVEDTQEPFHIYLLGVAIRKFIVEQTPQSLLEGSEDAHVERLKQPRAFRRDYQGPQTRGVHCLEDLVSEVGIGHVE